VSRIYTAAADGSEEVPLPTEEGAYDSEPAFSPGGGKVVFASDRDGDYDLYITNADGSDEPQRLTNNPGDERSPDWQPVR
jgi:TolB protein